MQCVVPGVMLDAVSFTADQSSRYHFSLHDEMTMTTHLALARDGESDYEMMKTQLCLEGTASYDTINILTVCHNNENINANNYLFIIGAYP